MELQKNATALSCYDWKNLKGLVSKKDVEGEKKRQKKMSTNLLNYTMLFIQVLKNGKYRQQNVTE